VFCWSLVLVIELKVDGIIVYVKSQILIHLIAHIFTSFIVVYNCQTPHMLAFIIGFIGCLLVVRTLATFQLATPLLYWMNVQPTQVQTNAIEPRRKRQRATEMPPVIQDFENQEGEVPQVNLVAPLASEATIEDREGGSTTDEDRRATQEVLRSLRERSVSRSTTRESETHSTHLTHSSVDEDDEEMESTSSSGFGSSSVDTSPSQSTDTIHRQQIDTQQQQTPPSPPVQSLQPAGPQQSSANAGNPSHIVQSFSNGSVPVIEPPKEIYNGWMLVRSKMVGIAGKFVWHKRYVSLREDGWMSWYKDERTKPSQCYGYIFLHGCKVYPVVKDQGCKPQPKSFKLIIENMEKRLVHRHGPDPTVKPIKRTKNFNVRGKKCRFKCFDDGSLLNWVSFIEKAIIVGNKASFSVEEGMVVAGGESAVMNQDIDEVAPLQSVPDVIAHPVQVQELNRPAIEATPTSSEFTQSQALVRAVSRELSRSSSVSGPALRPSLRRSKEFTVDDINQVEEEGIDPENRKGLLKELTRAAAGLDLFRIALPVSLNEPLSFLQRMCEQVAYYELLDKAASCEDSCHRLLYVAAFAISQYSSERTTKPFNPLLGETFEFVNDNMRFMAEQVSHHPPVGASSAESDNFQYFQDLSVKTRFGGNSIPCEEVGTHNLVLPNTGDKFSWPGIKTVVHNVIVGRMWIDHFGDLEIVNAKTGDKAKLEFTESGWFSKGRWEVSGHIVDAEGKTRISIKGKRNEYIDATVIRGPPLDRMNPIWTHDKLQHEQSHPWKLNQFVQQLNVIDTFLNETLPETDSRFRPDRIALEKQDMKRAAAEKRLLEQKQRDQAKIRSQTGRVWAPKFFDKYEESGTTYWRSNGRYWRQREQRLREYNNQ